MAGPKLKSAQITFDLPDGDDKDTDTGVTVRVKTRFNDQFDLVLASLSNFASNDTWEDTGAQTYTYPLNFAAVGIDQIDKNIKTTITIHPNGNDTVKFGYTLLLVFDDEDPETDPIPLEQRRSDITLSQDNRTYSS